MISFFRSLIHSFIQQTEASHMVNYPPRSLLTVSVPIPSPELCVLFQQQTSVALLGNLHPGNPHGDFTNDCGVIGNQKAPDSWPLIRKSESAGCSVMSIWSCPLYSPRNSPGQNTRVGSLPLLQGNFPIQGSNPDLPHCRRILYQLSHKGNL